MNARTPCGPLFRNELGIDHTSKVAWALGVGVSLAGGFVISFVPLLLMVKASESNLATFFDAFAGLLGFGLVWWLAVTGWMFAFALFPGISNPGQSVRAFEFIFTRAIDRRRLFRIRAIVIYALLLGPLLLNVLLSFGLPETKLVPDASNPASAMARREQYEKAFPVVRQTLGSPKTPHAPNVIPRGGVALAGWLLWVGTSSLLLMQSYCLLIGRWFPHNVWLAGVAIATPVLIAFFSAPWITRYLPGLYEASFLFFTRHCWPLAIGLLVLIPLVQIFSERTFSKLEIF